MPARYSYIGNELVKTATTGDARELVRQPAWFVSAAVQRNITLAVGWNPLPLDATTALGAVGSLSGNKLIAPVDGLYLINFVGVNISVIKRACSAFVVNATTWSSNMQVPAIGVDTDVLVPPLTGMVRLKAGDYVVLFGQTETAIANVAVDPNINNRVTMTLLETVSAAPPKMRYVSINMADGQTMAATTHVIANLKASSVKGEASWVNGNIFTLPVSGIYSFSFSCRVSGVNTRKQGSFTTSVDNISDRFGWIAHYDITTAYEWAPLNATVHLDAGTRVCLTLWNMDAITVPAYDYGRITIVLLQQD
jgi:hypothetical protein